MSTAPSAARLRRVQPSWPGGVVSFSFDDFPKTAWTTGGEILERYDARATYYVASALAGEDSPSGRCGDAEDIRAAYLRGHEIASHTHSHMNCAKADEAAMLSEVQQNTAALSTFLSDFSACNFAYPYGATSDLARQVLSARYATCRGIKGGINRGQGDIAELRANALYSRNFDEARIRALIDENRATGGWLIFYTHDVAASPSLYGCQADELEAVVAYAAKSSPVRTVRDVVERWSGLASE